MADLINSTLDDIAAVIGFSATIRLAANYGDRDVNVPLVVSDLHPVAKLIGVSRMKALHTAWSGERIAVPSLKMVESEVRRAKILSLLLQGVGTYAIAEVMNLTNRRVHQIKKEFMDIGLLTTSVSTGNSTEEIDAEIEVENATQKFVPKLVPKIDTEN